MADVAAAVVGRVRAAVQQQQINQERSGGRSKTWMRPQTYLEAGCAGRSAQPG